MKLCLEDGCPAENEVPVMIKRVKVVKCSVVDPDSHPAPVLHGSASFWEAIQIHIRMRIKVESLNRILIHIRVTNRISVQVRIKVKSRTQVHIPVK